MAIIQFELRTVEVVGGTRDHDTEESKTVQSLRIRAGVVGLPEESKYNLPERMADYVFEDTLTITEAKDGVEPFAQAWVASEYPDITE